jgi:hypothetical protein
MQHYVVAIFDDPASLARGKLPVLNEFGSLSDKRLLHHTPPFASRASSTGSRKRLARLKADRNGKIRRPRSGRFEFIRLREYHKAVGSFFGFRSGIFSSRFNSGGNAERCALTCLSTVSAHGIGSESVPKTVTSARRSILPSSLRG